MSTFQLRSFWMAGIALGLLFDIVTVTSKPSNQRQSTQEIEGCNKMDLIWSIPDHANARDTNHAIDLIRNISSEMTIDPSHVMVGLTQRICVAANSAAIRLKDYDTWSGLSAQLNQRRTRDIQTDKHLLYIRTKGMTSASGAREGIPKFGILIIDGAHGHKLEATLEEAKEAKDEESDTPIQLVVIGVGADVELEELRQIASSEKDVLYVPGYEELHTLKKRINSLLCRGTFAQKWPHRYYSSSKRHYDLEEQLAAMDNYMEE